MWSTLFWICVGILIGWNLPQPAWAKSLQDKVVSAINTFPDSKVAIGGHTDSRGSKDRNLRISIDRARNVVTFLAQVGGIAAPRLSSEGNGETKPVASNDTAEGRAQNRRIEVTIINGNSGMAPKVTASGGG